MYWQLQLCPPQSWLCKQLGWFKVHWYHCQYITSVFLSSRTTVLCCRKKLSTLKYARARFYAEASMGGDFGAKILAGILRVTSYEELRSHTEKLLKVFRSFLHVFSFWHYWNFHTIIWWKIRPRKFLIIWCFSRDIFFDIFEVSWWKLNFGAFFEAWPIRHL